VIRSLAARLRSAPAAAVAWPDDLDGAAVVAVCHPDWRGVRTAAHSHGIPVVQTADAEANTAGITARLADAGTQVVVVHGWPPGSAALLRALAGQGVATRCVLHSSMAQHGGEAAEAAVADEVLRLAAAGVIGRVGFVKEGLAEAFAALGHPTAWVPNRIPVLPDAEPADLGPGLHVGVFAEPFWRKNVVTQLGAVALLEGATAHVLRRPAVHYLDHLRIVEHGVLGWEAFIRLQAGVGLNLYVTLSECHPLSPIESYAAGVPCLMSRTSHVFRDDPALWELTTVAELDNPRAIAAAAHRLLEARDTAVAAARRWIDGADTLAAERWQAFVQA
jgi:hypothetical protein